MLDTKSKYRLIGAGLLIASSAILLPLVLDGERPQSLDVQIVVPERPEFPEVAVAPVQPIQELEQQARIERKRSANDIELIPEPDRRERSAPLESRSTTQPDPATKTVEVLQPKPAPKKEVVPVGERWTLQVATFGQKANADRTLKKLKDAGYPAYVMTSNSLFKIFVGPELSREASEKVKTKVQQEFKLSGIVVKYSPNS